MEPFDAYRELFSLKGKVAMVAGGAGGIGSAVSEGLAAFGASVAVCGRTGAKVEEVTGGIEACGGRAWGAELDIRKGSEQQLR